MIFKHGFETSEATCPNIHFKKKAHSKWVQIDGSDLKPNFYAFCQNWNRWSGYTSNLVRSNNIDSITEQGHRIDITSLDAHKDAINRLEEFKELVSLVKKIKSDAPLFHERGTVSFTVGDPSSYKKDTSMVRTLLSTKFQSSYDKLNSRYLLYSRGWELGLKKVDESLWANKVNQTLSSTKLPKSPLYKSKKLGSVLFGQCDCPFLAVPCEGYVSHSKIYIRNGKIYDYVWGCMVKNEVRGVHLLSGNKWKRIIPGTLDSLPVFSPDETMIAYSKNGKVFIQSLQAFD